LNDKFGIHAALLLAILVFTAAIYAPGLRGPFAFDDFNNIVRNKNLVFDGSSVEDVRQALLSGIAGPLKRPISMLSFAANRTTTGLDPFGFKLTNLAIHLLNGLLVYSLVRRLLALREKHFGERFNGAPIIAAAACALWLVHPAQLTSVLYVVQRMTSLSATFVFCGLLLYLSCRAQLLAGRPWLWRLWIGVPTMMLLGSLTKENGALLPVFALTIEYCLLQFKSAPKRRVGSLAQFYLLFVALPVLAAVAYMVLNPEWLQKPQLARPYTVFERVLTESRVLFLYLKLLVFPSIADFALYYDDFRISRSLLDPPTTVLAVGTLTLLLTAALVLRRRTPWFAFAVLWFMAAHLLESTVIMLELVHVHRNYIAYLGPILAGSVAVSRLPVAKSSRIGPWAVVTLVLATGGITALRAQQWSNPSELAAYEVHHRPGSARANYDLGRLYYIAHYNSKKDEYLSKARQYFERSSELDRNSINGLVGLLIINSGARYQAEDPAMAELIRRLQHRPVTPSDVHYLRSLVDCQGEETCNRPTGDILNIYGAALGHPGLHGKIKADLLALTGMYYANHLRDLPACIRLMNEAVGLVPTDPNHRLNLVQAYLAQGDIDAGSTELRKAASLDSFGVYRERIDSLERDIEELRKTDATPQHTVGLRTNPTGAD